MLAVEVLGLDVGPQLFWLAIGAAVFLFTNF